MPLELINALETPTLPQFPTEIECQARVHFYKNILSKDRQLHKVILVDDFCWRTGPHLYFVPVYGSRDEDLADAQRRHTTAKGSGAQVTRTALHVLEAADFMRLYPAPKTGRIGFIIR